MNIIAEGFDLNDLAQYEGLLSEGDKGEVRIYLSQDLSLETVTQLQNNLLAQGVVLTAPLRQENRILIIPFQKAVFPLLPIVIVAGGIISLVLGWQIFQEVTKIPTMAWVVGLGIVGLLIVKEFK